MTKYSFEQVVGALGLSVPRGTEASQLGTKAFITMRRFIWRNYRLTLSTTKDGWFSLVRRKRTGTKERVIYSRDKAIAGALWQAADYAKRSKLGIYA